MSNLWNKIKALLNKYPGVFISVLIIAAVFILGKFTLNFSLNDPEALYEKAMRFYDQAEYEKALKYLKEAKYYAKNDFDINYSIANTIFQMPSLENQERLFRYYVAEATRCAKTITQLKKIRDDFWNNPLVQKKFVSVNQVKKAEKEEIQEKIRLLRAGRPEPKCDSYLSCYEAAEGSFAERHYIEAEEFLVEAVFFAKATPENVYSHDKYFDASVLLGRINLAKELYIKKKPCEALKTSDLKKDEVLIDLYKIKTDNCAERAEQIFRKLKEKENADYQNTVYSQMAFYHGISIIIAAEKPGENKTAIEEAFSYIKDEPFGDESAHLIRLAADQIDSWQSQKYNDERIRLYKSALEYYKKVKEEEKKFLDKREYKSENVNARRRILLSADPKSSEYAKAEEFISVYEKHKSRQNQSIREIQYLKNKIKND